MKNNLSFICIFILFSCTTLDISYPLCDFPEHSPFPGGVISQTLRIDANEINEIDINQKNVYLCQMDKDHWKILAPISLSEEIKTIAIVKNGQPILEVPISNKAYRESKITITNQDLVSPPEEYLSRIKMESDLGKVAIGTVSRRFHTSLKMPAPTQGIKSSEFGVKRFINNQPRNRHTGLDLAAPIGTEIISPLSGKVILVGNFYYRGKTVFLDHGGGMISTYSHMSKVAVQQGQSLEKGDLIGAVGQSGRVTGPHLHWQIILSGIPVDPELFLEPSS